MFPDRVPTIERFGASVLGGPAGRSTTRLEALGRDLRTPCSGIATIQAQPSIARALGLMGAAIAPTGASELPPKPAQPLEPVAAILRAVRAANATLPRSRRLRVLLGDPPIDWSKVRSWEDVNQWDRDAHPAEVIGREVLGKHRRAPVIYGGLHFQRKNIFTNHDMHDEKAQMLLSVLDRSGEIPFRAIGGSRSGWRTSSTRCCILDPRL